MMLHAGNDLATLLIKCYEIPHEQAVLSYVTHSIPKTGTCIIIILEYLYMDNSDR